MPGNRPPQERTTEASQKIGSASLEQIVEESRKPVPGLDLTRYRQRGDMDRFDLTRGGVVDPTTQYNHVGPARVVKFLRRPEYWDRHGVTDRLAEVDDLMSSIGGDMQIVTRKRDNRPVIEDDTIAVSIPRAVQEEYERAEKEAAERFDRYIEEGEFGQLLEEESDLEGWAYHNKSNPKAQEFNAQQSRRRLHQSGLTGERSPTHGLTYKQAFSTIPEGERLATEARLRAGNRHISGLSTREEAREVAVAQAKGRKTFGGLAGSAQYDQWERTGDKK